MRTTRDGVLGQMFVFALCSLEELKLGDVGKTRAVLKCSGHALSNFENVFVTRSTTRGKLVCVDDYLLM